MSGIFRTLQIGISALMAHQRAIDVVGQNIANINTPDYQRRRVSFRELSGPSGVINPPVLGNGVYAAGVERLTTPFVDAQLRRQRSIHAYYQERSNLLGDVEAILNEPSETGIAASLDAFWQAWQDLTVSPAEMPVRMAVVQAGSRLASTIRESARFLGDMQANLDTQIEAKVGQINDLAAEIAELNRQIAQANAQAGGRSGALPLEQRRDELLFQLSELVNFSVSFDESGIARLSIGNFALVDDGGARAIVLNDQRRPEWETLATEVRVSGGELAALLEMRDTTLTGYLERLDQLAGYLADNVNQLHRQGYGLDGATDLDFFLGSDASTLDVNPVLFQSPASVATAAQGNSAGDIDIASQIAELASRPVIGTPPTTTINAFYRSLIADLGMESRHVQASTEQAQLVINHLEDRRQAISGVSMDEEITYLVNYEKAFQASARIINVVDEMLDTIINRMGLVGR